MILDGASGTDVAAVIKELAVATVYGPDKRWNVELKAGNVTFDGSSGWRQALQEFVEMNSAGCFQPGALGTTQASGEAEFAEGQGLMRPDHSGAKGAIDQLSPQFDYSFRPFPSASAANETATLLHICNSLSVNAHATAPNRAAALSFIDFVARPKQNALYTEVTGGLTQYEFLKGQIPDFMHGFATVFARDEYVVDPSVGWWTPNVYLALQTDGIGLITGQETIDDVLNAMDAAWKQGPS
jgi:raffinose/stachyose/melibiose transport system substrate-binding protein